MEISRDRSKSTLTISQSSYVQKIGDKYLQGANTKLWSSPVGSTEAEIKRFNSMKPASSDEENIRLQGVDYLGLIGSILYATNLTRPDGAFYANHCAKFMQKPKREHSSIIHVVKPVGRAGRRVQSGRSRASNVTHERRF